ncbi:MAG: dTDP-4-dehydrorhamnose reductase [Candidatus Riflebacteria bacterium]|nr:dTDP-4-dehydrorhamnose reductase [Candidatus Riflebacteria bacterium]
MGKQQIWIPGCSGMLGSQIIECLKDSQYEIFATDRDLDITDGDVITSFLSDKKLSWIINCAAYTAVDKAETDQESSFAVNALGPKNLARVATKIGAKLIHFSTDYVFDGKLDRPYVESDSPAPVSVYGRSKLAGEDRIKDFSTKYFIFRISWLYGQNGANFVKTIVRLLAEKDELRVVSDQIGSPTWAKQLSMNISDLIGRNSTGFGTYHYSDLGDISWYEFALAIKEFALSHKLLEKDTPVIAIPTSEFPRPAVRPLNSRFNKKLIVEELNFKVNPWKENLEQFFKEWG